LNRIQSDGFIARIELVRAVCPPAREGQTLSKQDEEVRSVPRFGALDAEIAQNGDMESQLFRPPKSPENALPLEA